VLFTALLIEETHAMRKPIYIFALCGLLMMVSTPASAHGGVSIEEDQCILTIGPYKMHFTGYQPEVAPEKEFCEDIPAVGRAIIVLDYLDTALRELATGVRIVEAESWTAAQAAVENAQQPTVLHRPPKTYKTGTLQIEHQFDKPGYFVGLVTVQGDRQEQLISRFPFSVGRKATSQAPYTLAVMALLLAGLGAVYYFYQSRKRGGGPPSPLERGFKA
jgi:hypothetical protein